VATNNKITTTELDFDNIKSNIKSFLRGQSDLSDYDFEGSGLSVLLDVLAYNTHYNALYTNLAVNESFLDSAVKRESVVSRAFELGYLPRSASTSIAKVNIKLTNVSGAPDTIVLNALTPFTTTVNGSPYVFYNDVPYIAVNTSGTYTFSNVKLLEGTPLTQSYVVSDSSRYIISNTNCDISTLTVGIFNNINSSIVTNFRKVDDILSITATDNVYFIKEIENGLYEIQFGNDRIGKSVSAGNVVTLSYFVTNKAVANGAKVFSSGSLSNYTISTVSSSRGGAEAETIEEIKHNSPRFYSASNRAVTNEDYRAIIINNFPNVKAIQVWGGDEDIPPVYGKVFISIAPKDNVVLTDAEKVIIKEDILRSKKVVTITPEFVDPTYLNIALKTTIYYDPNVTTQTANTLVTQVKNNILKYNDTDLRLFDSIFRFSKLMNIIDSTDQSITSNISSFTISRRLLPKFNIIANYNFHIENPIYNAGVPENAVTSNGFYVFNDSKIQYIRDDGFGNLQRYYLDSNNNIVVVNSKQGTVTYSTGEINLVALNITRLVQAELIFTLKLQSNDIISIREHIVRIEPLQLVVSAIAETKVVGSQYIFTPSR
jgi:hypothetical protein